MPWQRGHPLFGNLPVNILILTATTVLGTFLLPSTRGTDGGGALRNLTTGFLAAAAVLFLLILVRRLIPGRTTTLFRTTTWLVIVVIAEETAKLLATAPLRKEGETPRLSAAALRGWGFATAEHLLYTAISPAAFALRMVTAGALHVGTTVYYTLPHKPDQPHSAILPRRFILATVFHLLFNFALTSLDSIRSFW